VRLAPDDHAGPSSSPTRHAGPAPHSTARTTTRPVAASSTPRPPASRHLTWDRPPWPPPYRTAAGRREISPHHDLCPSHPIAARAAPSLCASYPITGSRDSGRPPQPRRSTGEHKYLPLNRLIPAINGPAPSSPHHRTTTTPPLPCRTVTSSHHREPITTAVSPRGADSTARPSPR
jgi:hypothetical protein